MATQTPVKEKQIDCFVCCSNSIRPIRLSGRKSKKDGFSEKVKCVLKDDNLFLHLTNCDPLVCRLKFHRLWTQPFLFTLGQGRMILIGKKACKIVPSYTGNFVSLNAIINVSRLIFS